jgi:hypothetical protein
MSPSSSLHQKNEFSGIIKHKDEYSTGDAHCQTKHCSPFLFPTRSPEITSNRPVTDHSLTHSLARAETLCDAITRRDHKAPSGGYLPSPSAARNPPMTCPSYLSPHKHRPEQRSICMARIGDTWTPKPSTVHLRIMHMLSPRLDLILLPACLPACLPLLRDKPPGPHGWPLTPSLARSHTHRNRMHRLRLLPTSLSLSPKFDSFLRKLFFWDKRTSLTLLKNVL